MDGSGRLGLNRCQRECYRTDFTTREVENAFKCVLSVCARVRTPMCIPACSHCACMEVRGQLAGAGSLLALYRLWGPGNKLRHQAWQQAPSPPEAAHLP